MAISTRQAGTIVECPTCHEPTPVPLDDIFAPGTAKPAPTADQPASPLPSSSPVLDENDSDGGTPDAIEFESYPELEVEPTQGRDVPEEAQAEPDAVAPVGRQDSPPPDDSRIPSHPAPAAAMMDVLHAEIEDEEPATFIRRRRLSDDEMDLTPMVDVTFQLLIFFMVSASFSLQKSIEVPTPDPDQQGASQQVQLLNDLQGTSIILKIDSSNAIWVDDEPLNDPQQLTDVLRDKMRKEQKTELLLTADSQSQHRTIIAVIDAANEVGMQKIRMTSRKKAE